eukprot:m.195668 g.195668  ORF g.195668 m.195668 type:complete len:1614 (-) comp16807_c0_seq1:84-4925(-)
MMWRHHHLRCLLGGFLLLLALVQLEPVAVQAQQQQVTLFSQDLSAASAVSPVEQTTLLANTNASYTLPSATTLWAAQVNASSGVVQLETTQAGLSIRGNASALFQVVLDITSLESVVTTITLSTQANYSLNWELLAAFDTGTVYSAATGTLPGLRYASITPDLNFTLSELFSTANFWWRLDTGNDDAHVTLHNVTVSASTFQLEDVLFQEARPLNTSGLPVTSGMGSLAATTTLCQSACDQDATCTFAVFDTNASPPCTLYQTPQLDWTADPSHLSTIVARTATDFVATSNQTRQSLTTERFSADGLIQAVHVSTLSAGNARLLDTVALPMVLVENSAQGCDGILVNISIYETATETDYHGGVPATLVATASLSSETLPILASADEENIHLSPNWWTTVKLVWKVDALLTADSLGSVLVRFTLTPSSTCQAIVFGSMEASSQVPAAFMETTQATGMQPSEVIFSGDAIAAHVILRLEFAPFAAQVLSFTKSPDRCDQFGSQTACDASAACAYYGCRAKAIDSCNSISSQSTCELTDTCAYDYDTGVCFTRSDLLCSLTSCPSLLCYPLNTCLPVSETLACEADLPSTCLDHLGCHAVIDCITQQITECGATSACLSVCPFHLLQSQAQLDAVEGFVTCLQQGAEFTGLLGALLGAVGDLLGGLLGLLGGATNTALSVVFVSTQHTLVALEETTGLPISGVGVLVSVVQETIELILDTVVPSLIPTLLPTLFPVTTTNGSTTTMMGGGSSMCGEEMAGGILWPASTGGLVLQPCPLAAQGIATRYCCGSSPSLGGLLGTIFNNCGQAGWMAPDLSTCGSIASALFSNLQASLPNLITTTSSALSAVQDVTQLVQNTAVAAAASVNMALSTALNATEIYDLQVSTATILSNTLSLAISTVAQLAEHAIVLAADELSDLIQGLVQVVDALQLDTLVSSTVELVQHLLEDTVGSVVHILSAPLGVVNTLLSFSVTLISTVQSLPLLTDLSTRPYFLRIYNTTGPLEVTTDGVPAALYRRNRIRIPSELTRLGPVVLLAYSPFSSGILPTLNVSGVPPLCLSCAAPADQAHVVSDVIDVTLAGGSSFQWPNARNISAQPVPAELSVAFNLSASYGSVDHLSSVVANAVAGMTAFTREEAVAAISDARLALNTSEPLLQLFFDVNVVASIRQQEAAAAASSTASSQDLQPPTQVVAPPCLLQKTCQESSDGQVIIRLPLACHWWDPTSKSWSTSGCSTGTTPDGLVECTCTHTTSYAVLMKSDAVSSFSSQDTVALEIITYLGCGVSIAGLVFTVITHAWYWSRHFIKEHQKLIAVLAGTVCVAQTLLLVVVTRSSSIGGTGCIALSAGMHFFLLLSFGCMIVVGFNVYQSFVAVMKQHSISMARALTANAVVAAVIVAATYVSSPKDFTSDDFCWLDMQTPTAMAVIVPLGFMLLTNTIMAIMSLRSISKEASLRVQLRAAFTFMWIMGLSWVFAAISLLDPNQVLWQYLFAFFSVSQGIFLFIHYVMCSERMRDAMFVNRSAQLSRRQQTMMKVREQDRQQLYRSSSSQESSAGRSSRPSQSLASTSFGSSTTSDTKYSTTPLDRRGTAPSLPDRQSVTFYLPIRPGKRLSTLGEEE